MLFAEGRRTEIGTVIEDADRRIHSARQVRQNGFFILTIGTLGALTNTLWGGLRHAREICLILVMIGATMILLSSRSVRRATEDFHRALERLELKEEWSDLRGFNLDMMKSFEIRDGGGIYYLQRGYQNLRIAEGKGGIDLFNKDNKRVDSMGARPEIEAAMIEPRPSEKIVEEANAKRGMEANTAFLLAEKSDAELIEAGFERLGDDIDGSIKISERT